MKTTTSLLFGLALLFCAGSLHASTPQSADEYLVSPWSYQNQTIKLKVIFVKPAHFQSPRPDVIFYHATTVTVDRQPGGQMLVAVPKSESQQFARFYGLNPHGKNSRILSGTLLLKRGPRFFWHKDHLKTSSPLDSGTTQMTGTTSNETNRDKSLDRSGEWFVDYKGLNSEVLDNLDKDPTPDLSGSETQ